MSTIVRREASKSDKFLSKQTSKQAKSKEEIGSVRLYCIAQEDNKIDLQSQRLNLGQKP